MVQDSKVQQNTVQHGIVQHHTVQYYTIQVVVKPMICALANLLREVEELWPKRLKDNNKLKS